MVQNISRSTIARTHLLGAFLARNDGDSVSFTDPGNIKLGVFFQSVLGFMYGVQDCLVRSIRFVKDVVGCVRLHFTDDVKHLRDRKLMFCKGRLSEIVENTIAVLTLVALRILSRRSFLDRVRARSADTSPRRTTGDHAGTPNSPLCQAETPRWRSLSTDHAVVGCELQS